jgi:arylformamidase
MTNNGSNLNHLVSRRTMLGIAASAAASAVLAPSTVFAQQAMRCAPVPAAGAKGPRVFLDYDQAELDIAYDQAPWAPNLLQLGERRAINSELVRQRIGAPRRIPYGPSDAEKLDIYTTTRPNAPIMVFIHGGAWRSGLAKDFGYPAEMFVRAGAHYVVPDFVAVEAAGGNLITMAEQVRRAVAWVYKNAASFGGDPGRLYLSGHSSGAHLGGCAVITDWQKEFGLPADTLKGAMLVSGMYDLRAPRLSARSSYVKFTDEMEQSLSAQRHLDRINVPLVVAHASLDTPDFQRQSRDFAEALRKAGKPVQTIRGEGYNHFEFPETLANPFGILGSAALVQMKLAAS